MGQAGWDTRLCDCAVSAGIAEVLGECGCT